MTAATVWSFIQWVHYFALMLWIGSIIAITSVAAPAVRQSMASKTITGDIAARMFKRLNVVEFVSCLLLIATSFLSFRFVYNHKETIWLLIGMVILMGFLTSYYAFHLGPQMARIRDKVPTFDSLSAEHESKKEFRRHHKAYVSLMCLNLILGLMVLYGSILTLK